MAGYDLCIGKDSRARSWATQVPTGIVRTGMFVRLLGGVFILVEQVERNGHTTAPVREAVQVLEGIWAERGYE